MTDWFGRARRYFTELAVIVVGVLIALGLEASWGRLQDRLREADLLRDLEEEFVQNEARLQTDLAFNDSVAVALDAWHHGIATGAPPSIDSMKALLDANLYMSRFDPLTGVLTSIVETGELALVRDPALRHAIAGWGGRVEEAKITALDVQAYRAEIMPELLDVVHGAPAQDRHESLLRGLGAFTEIVMRQQRALLSEIRRVRDLIRSNQDQVPLKQ